MGLLRIYPEEHSGDFEEQSKTIREAFGNLSERPSEIPKNIFPRDRNGKGTNREYTPFVPLAVCQRGNNYSFQKRQLANACR